MSERKMGWLIFGPGQSGDIDRARVFDYLMGRAVSKRAPRRSRSLSRAPSARSIKKRMTGRQMDVVK